MRLRLAELQLPGIDVAIRGRNLIGPSLLKAAPPPPVAQSTKRASKHPASTAVHSSERSISTSESSSESSGVAKRVNHTPYVCAASPCKFIRVVITDHHIGTLRLIFLLCGGVPQILWRLDKRTCCANFVSKRQRTCVCV